MNNVMKYTLLAIDKLHEYTKIPKDKIEHILIGLFITFLSVLMVGYNTDNIMLFVILSLLPATIIGGAKELIWDKKWKRGYPSWMDFLATALSGIPIVLIYIWIV